MTDPQEMTLEGAIEMLAQYGITGPYIYLVDIIPLIEMIWADGKVQGAEVGVLRNYVSAIVKRINAACGSTALSMEQAGAFVKQFLVRRPNPELLRRLRALVTVVSFRNCQSDKARDLKESLLAACIGIAESASSGGQAGGDCIEVAETACFFEILNSLT
jgi:hypothetical protein